MKGEKVFICVFAIIVIGAGLLSCMEETAGKFPNVSTEVTADKSPKAPMVTRAEVGFPGGGIITYEVDSGTGCIKNFFYKNGEPIKSQTPSWLVKGKEILYFGSFNNSQCQQGIIGIGGSPIEFNGIINNIAFCLGAWDPECGRYGHWYQPCQETYTCP